MGSNIGQISLLFSIYGLNVGSTLDHFYNIKTLHGQIIEKPNDTFCKLGRNNGEPCTLLNHRVVLEPKASKTLEN